MDLPSPGLPRMNAEGLEISRARWNQLIGSQQTVAWVSSWRPSGTPIMGEDAPEENGHSPQTWTVVPRYSVTDGTSCGHAAAASGPATGSPARPRAAACSAFVFGAALTGSAAFLDGRVKSFMRAITGHP